MPTLKKTEDGYVVTWIKCERCGSPMEELEKPKGIMNYQCMVCNRLAKVSVKKPT